jgi:branched-chain amino acid transport system permease protein
MWVGVPVIFSGFALGSFYALIALGFSLILGTARAFNLAHGEMIVLSGYLALVLWQFFQVPFYWILPICAVVLLLLTMPLHYLLRRLPEPYGLNTLMVTLGLALLLQAFLLACFSADYRLMMMDWPALTLSGVNFSFPFQQAVLIILALLVTGGVHLLLQHTFMGKALRATIQDRGAAQMAGINVHWMALVAFGLGGLLIGLAGPLFAQNMYLYPAAGAEATMIAIVVTIFAGLGRAHPGQLATAHRLEAAGVVFQAGGDVSGLGLADGEQEMVHKGPPAPGGPGRLEIDHPVALGDEPVELLLGGFHDLFVRIHAVDAHGLASGQERALAEHEGLGQGVQGKLGAVALAEADRRAVEENGNLIIFI